MANSVQIKKGDSLVLTCADDSGDLSTATIEAAVKLGGFYKALTFAEVGYSGGVYTYTLSADTSTFPIGSLDCDIKYTDASDVITYQPTFQIVCQESVTK